MLSVVWLRKDLRIEDNTALNNALLENEGEILLLFHLNPDQFLEESYNHGAFFSTLWTFYENLKKKNITLNILFGDIKESFLKLKRKRRDWGKIYFNKDERGFGKQRDDTIRTFFSTLGVKVFSFQDSHLHGAHEIKTISDAYYQVFTPYYSQWKKIKKRLPVKQKIDPSIFIKDILFEDDFLKFQNLSHVIKKPPIFSSGLDEARKYLKYFIQNSINNYDVKRDIPSINGTSRLSSFLRSGDISIREVWEEIQKVPDCASKEVFEKEICWRDFYNMIYACHPRQKEQEIKNEFSFIEWENNEENFYAWIEGRTGFPIVDAAMIQLKECGWMHNRLRMISASFLVKDLLIDWRFGEKYFQKMLIDYDSASNIGGWQWCASTGTDSVPYFRIFNPYLQSKKFDPNGEFIKKQIPRLKNKSLSQIHEQGHVKPIIDHIKARERTIKAYEDSKIRYYNLKTNLKNQTN